MDALEEGQIIAGRDRDASYTDDVLLGFITPTYCRSPSPPEEGQLADLCPMLEATNKLLQAGRNSFPVQSRTHSPLAYVPWTERSIPPHLLNGDRFVPDYAAIKPSRGRSSKWANTEPQKQESRYQTQDKRDERRREERPHRRGGRKERKRKERRSAAEPYERGKSSRRRRRDDHRQQRARKATDRAPGSKRRKGSSLPRSSSPIEPPTPTATTKDQANPEIVSSSHRKRLTVLLSAVSSANRRKMSSTTVSSQAQTSPSNSTWSTCSTISQDHSELETLDHLRRAALATKKPKKMIVDDPSSHAILGNHPETANTPRLPGPSMLYSSPPPYLHQPSPTPSPANPRFTQNVIPTARVLPVGAAINPRFQSIAHPGYQAPYAVADQQALNREAMTAWTAGYSRGPACMKFGPLSAPPCVPPLHEADSFAAWTRHQGLSDRPAFSPGASSSIFESRETIPRLPPRFVIPSPESTWHKERLKAADFMGDHETGQNLIIDVASSSSDDDDDDDSCGSDTDDFDDENDTQDQLQSRTTPPFDSQAPPATVALNSLRPSSKAAQGEDHGAQMQEIMEFINRQRHLIDSGDQHTSQESNIASLVADPPPRVESRVVQKHVTSPGNPSRNTHDLVSPLQTQIDHLKTQIEQREAERRARQSAKPQADSASQVATSRTA
ncbi:unnamed protein product [Sympodiomycopsis kandeliae]